MRAVHKETELFKMYCFTYNPPLRGDALPLGNSLGVVAVGETTRQNEGAVLSELLYSAAVCLSAGGLFH
jgi:hypothetical protein